jgi:HD-like signal output (HDOD) protein
MAITREQVDTLRIPTLPTSVIKIRELLSDEAVGVAEVAAALAQDPPMAVKVLRIANSVQYGSREARTSVHAAASVLGLRTIASIVLRAGVLSLFDNLKDVDGFSITKLWKHSILTAHAAEELAKVLRRRASDFGPQDYYTCGLLHDIGQVVLFDNFGTDYVAILKGRSEDQTEAQAEAGGLLGLDHAEMGALAATMWRLPAPIPDMIRWHHRHDARGPLADLVLAISFSDHLAEVVLENPTKETRDLVGDLGVLPPGCTPAMAAELLQVVRRHFESLEL